MKNHLRIVFAYCSDDPWIAGVADDLHRAARALGHEVYVIAAGPFSAAGQCVYINTDHLQNHYYFSRIIERMRYPSVDLTEIAGRESLFLSHIRHESQESSAEIRDRLRAWFAEAMLILKIIQPDAVMVWNGLYSRRAVYLRAARHLTIPAYYAEKGMLPGSWYIDPQGVSVMSSMAETRFPSTPASGSIDAFKKRLASIDEKGMSAWEQPQRKDLSEMRGNLKLRDGQKILFFPGQVDYDTNILLFSKHFTSSLEALAWLVHELSDGEFYVVAKPHPKGNTGAGDYGRILNGRGSVLPEINVIDAIELADCIVSINSTTAFEAAIRGKPVLVLGEGILNDKDFVSTYCPGKGAAQQVRECMERYGKKRDEYVQQALALAAHLDAEYYAYRGDKASCARLLKRIDGVIPAGGHKLFDHHEVAAILQNIPYEDFEGSFLQGASPGKMAGWFSAGTLLQSLLEKIKNRCRSWIG